MSRAKLSRPKNVRTVQGALLLGRNAGQRTIFQMPAIPVAVACALGILLGKFLPLGILSWLGLAVGSLVMTICFQRLRAWRFSVLTFVTISMASWTVSKDQPPSHIDVSNWAPSQFHPVVVQGKIASTVELRPNSLVQQRSRSQTASPSPSASPSVQSVVELTLDQVRDGSEWETVSGKVRMVIDGDASALLVGDHITVYGQIAKIGPPSNPGETDFRKLFHSRGIRGRIMVESVDQIELNRKGSPGFMRLLSWVSSRGDQVLREVIGDQQAALASAIVLGRRMSVPPKTRDLLVETGTVHLLSVSGLHLAMVASIAKALVLLTGLSRTTQIILVLSVCVFFAGLTGANPPVLRASFLVATVLLASWAARIPHTINSLAIAAILLMLLHPSTLLETGAQLSFIAVATLVVTGRSLTDVARQDIAVQKLLEESQAKWYVRLKSTGAYFVASIKVSFWVWIVTAPLVWQAYHVVAPIAIVANLVVVPLLAVALTFGLLTTSIGLASQTLALPFGFACKFAVTAIVSVSAFCSEIPWAFVWLPAPPVWLVAVYYLGLLIPTLASKTQIFPDTIHFPQHFRLGWSILWFLIAVPTALHKFQQPSENLEVTFVDVGHGTSVLIKLPDDQGTWLYDAGRLGDPTWSLSPIESVLWDDGVYSLDGLIISHADADHYNAVPDLLRRFKVSNLYVPPGFMEDQQIGLRTLQQAISKYRPKINIVHEGSLLRDRDGKVWGSVLHPAAVRVEGSDNANSIVLQIDVFPTPFLLPGDLEMPGTDSILQIPRPRGGGVMMAPHHGSLQQDVRPLLDWQRPAAVIVSGGNRAAKPEVKRMQSQTGAACYITSELGAIRVIMTPDNEFEIWHWAEDHWEKCQ